MMDQPPTDLDLRAKATNVPQEEDEDATLLRQFEAHLLGLAACIKKFRKRRRAPTENHTPKI